MSDLVERARQHARNLASPPDDPVESYLTWQLAEEIVRLRMETSAMRQDREETNTAWQAEVERQRAREIELLAGYENDMQKEEAEVKRLRGLLANSEMTLAEVMAANELLMKALRKAAIAAPEDDVTDSLRQSYRDERAANDVLQTKIERLKAALRWVDGVAYGATPGEPLTADDAAIMRDIARAALEEK